MAITTICGKREHGGGLARTRWLWERFHWWFQPSNRRLKMACQWCGRNIEETVQVIWRQLLKWALNWNDIFAVLETQGMECSIRSFHQALLSTFGVNAKCEFNFDKIFETKTLSPDYRRCEAPYDSLLTRQKQMHTNYLLPRNAGLCENYSKINYTSLHRMLSWHWRKYFWDFRSEVSKVGGTEINATCEYRRRKTVNGQRTRKIDELSRKETYCRKKSQ